MSKINMELTTENLKNLLGHSKDIIFRDIYLGSNKSIKATLIFIEGLTQKELLSDFVLKPLQENYDFLSADSEEEIVSLIDSGSIYYSDQKKCNDINTIVSEIFNGNSALIFDKTQTAFSFSVLSFKSRDITEPTNENVIKGAKDAFVEPLTVNIATIRRKIKTMDLIVEQTVVGKQSKTQLAIIYIRNLTNKNMVDEVRNRLASINIDGVMTTAFIEEYLISSKYSVFPQVLATERPDKFCSNILEGRIGVLIDGIPVTMIVPATLLQFIQAPEDYSQNYIITSILRIMRFSLVAVTLFLPGFYVAVTSFNHEMIPTELALSIEASKQGVPFPSFIETIMMLIAFEILVEAGIRLPRTIGQSLSIVGAVVVGQSAVEAKLVSPAVVVMIAITAISTFVMPNQDFSNALRFWRLIIVILSSIAGLFGMSFGGLLLLYHLGTIDNYGVSYLSPFAPSDIMQFQDVFIRAPISFMKKRPITLKTTNKTRQGKR